MGLAIQRKQNIPVRLGLVLVLLFAAALDLISRYYFFVFFAFFFFVIKSKRKIRVDSAVGFLLLLALSWVIFSPSSTTSILGILKPFTYILCYMMGAGLFDDGIENNKEKSPYRLFYLLIVVLALGTLSHYVLNWITNMGTADRNTIDVWTHDIMAATGQASLACLPLGLAIACIFSKNSKWIKLLSWATVVVIMLYNLVLSGRTLIVMFLTIVAIAFLHKLKNQKGKKIRVLVALIIVIVLLVLIYQSNLLGIRTYVENSPLYDRFFSADSQKELDDDTRLERKLFFLDRLELSVFGGANIRDEWGYAHDIILDTYDEAGIFALIAMLMYLGVSAYHLLKCIKNKRLPFAFRQTILCIYCICYLEFMVEPILQGMPWLFAAFCLIDGYVLRILNHSKKINSKVR